MIKAIDARCLKEVLLTYVPGIACVESNEEMNIAMRGVYSSGQENILIMLDGQRMNSYITNAISPDYAISMAKVKQIEVLRGPASSLYGSVALTAVVNIVSKDGLDIKGGKIALGAGNYGQASAEPLMGKHDLNTDFMGWLSMYRAEGEPVFVATATQYAVYPQDGTILWDSYSKWPALDAGIKYRCGNFSVNATAYHTKKKTAIQHVAVCGPLQLC